MAYACYARMARCRAANLSLLGSPKQPIFSGAMTRWNTDDQQIRLIQLIQLDNWTLMDQWTTTDYNGEILRQKCRNDSSARCKVVTKSQLCPWQPRRVDDSESRSKEVLETKNLQQQKDVE